MKKLDNYFKDYDWRTRKCNEGICMTIITVLKMGVFRNIDIARIIIIIIHTPTERCFGYSFWHYLKCNVGCEKFSGGDGEVTDVE